jgi:hypothetical protein
MGSGPRSNIGQGGAVGCVGAELLIPPCRPADRLARWATTAVHRRPIGAQAYTCSPDSGGSNLPSEVARNTVQLTNRQVETCGRPRSWRTMLAVADSAVLSAFSVATSPGVVGSNASSSSSVASFVIAVI